MEGIEKRRKYEKFDHDPIGEAEKIKEGYSDCPTITFKSGRAFYSPSDDTISLPEIGDFFKVEEYYSTLFHEMIHSTGSESRLNREKGGKFGSAKYSKEELIAEMGAAMLCSIAGIDNETVDNSAAYIDGWLQVLRGNPKLIVTAASQAQKAADYILGGE